MADEVNAPRRRRLNVGSTIQRLSVLIAWGLIVILFGVLRPTAFLTVNTFSSIFGSQAVLVFLTLGLVVTLRAGDYDLSVAGTLTFTSMLVAVLNIQHHIPIIWCILAALGTGGAVGLMNGILAVGLEIDSFIVTLGVGTFLAGLTLWISNDQTLSGVSTALQKYTVVDTVLSIPLEFYYALALCIILWYLFEFTGIGRRHLFVGKGPDVARLSGIPVARVRVMSFVATGVLSAGAGVLYTGTAGGADATSGLTFLLPAFAAAFLGSTTILVGQFNPVGAFVAAYFLATGITGLEILGAQNYVTDLFYGGALVVAVAATQIVNRRTWRGVQWRRRQRQQILGRARPSGAEARNAAGVTGDVAAASSSDRAAMTVRDTE